MVQDDEMEESAESNDNPIKSKMKSCTGGQKCWNGAQGKAVGGKARYSLSPRKKKAVEEAEKPTTDPAAGTHQNMRDLSGNSGDVSYYGQVNNSGSANYDTSAKSKMKKMEVDRTKTRKFFGK